MADSDDINLFVPSLLNPRAVRKSFENDLSQLSTASRLSLSLKRSRVPLQEIVQQRKTFVQPARKKILNVKSEVSSPCRILRDITHVQASITFPYESISDKPCNLNVLDQDEISCVYNGCKVQEIPKLLKKDTNIPTEDTYDKISEHSVETQIYAQNESTSGSPCNIFNGSDACTEIYGLTPSNCCIKELEFSDTEQDIIINCRMKETTPVNQNLSKRKCAPARKKKYPAGNKDIILILKQSTVKKYSHIVVQPPNCKFVKRTHSPRNECRSGVQKAARLQQSRITQFLRNFKRSDVSGEVVAERSFLHAPSSDDDCVFVSHTLSDVGAACNNVNTTMSRDDSSNATRKSLNRATSLYAGKEGVAPQTSKPKASGSLPLTPPTRVRLNTRPVPPYKIITGTNFIVDGFNYGEVSNATTFFLTHFHSDHYVGLTKSFRNILYCSKITAELCALKLGVNKKLIRIINVDESHCIDGVEVTAIDANHCPGALMLLFSLKSGMNVLHCGDFRATYQMESTPAFWNKQIHSVYLDTTYCNPRYDFPSQDESIQMALGILHQKKNHLEQAKKPFSTVLIVCGTYTVGKEKFFLGIAESEGVTVWATPERDRTLRVTQGRSFSSVSPREAQLHVLPMRELTHQKLKNHLDSMQGAFTEVVAFKPSGWEVRSGPAKQIDGVTIHGIPYSEHSSFSELLRFIKYLQPKLIIPTVEITGGIKSVQKYFPCPMASKEDATQKRVTEYFTAAKSTHQPAIT